MRKDDSLNVRTQLRHRMAAQELFYGLSPQEVRKAIEWYEHLENPEQERVFETLKAIHETNFALSKTENSVKGPVWVDYTIFMAVIVAGTSVDGARGTYKDIDLFLLPEESLYFSICEKHPKKLINELMGKLPPYAYGVIYGNDEDNMALRNEADPRIKGLGARVTVSVFHKLAGFDKRRKGKLDDLIEPPQPLGGEDIILFNREQESKFLVLDRQYLV